MPVKHLMKLVAITIIIFIISALVFANNMKTQSEHAFKQTGELLTTEISDMMDLWTQDQLRILTGIATNEYVIDMCLDPQDPLKVERGENFLKELHSRYPYYENLPVAVNLESPVIRTINGSSITVDSGEFLVDTVAGETIGKGGPQYSYIKEVFAGKPYYISEIYPSIPRGTPICVMSMPIVHDSRMVGIAIISPQMHYFTKMFIDSAKLGNTGYMFLLDETSKVIAHPNRDFILSDDADILEKSSYIISQIQNKNNFFKASLLERNKLYYGKTISLRDGNVKDKWYIVFSQETSEVYSDVYDFLKLMALIAIMSTALFVGCVAIVADINKKEQSKLQLMEMNSKLEHLVEERTSELRMLAYTDGLTQLYNHRHSYELLNKIIEDAQKSISQIVILLADLDKFKIVNDVYGHPVGDMVLKECADAIRQNIRANDIAGRYGGEEFLIILPDCTFESGEKIAERIRKSIEDKEFDIKGLRITISMGLTMWNGQNSSELVSSADALLYKAKNNGRNRVEIDPSIISLFAKNKLSD